MAKKKKKNRGNKSNSNKKAKKLQKKHFNDNQNQSQEESSTKALVASSNLTPSTVTTFSKKLEEVIAETETQSKKGLFRGRIILLGPPSEYFTDWKSVWKNSLHIMLRGIIVVFILCLLSSAVVALEVFSDSRIMPRVALAKQDLGYLKINEAQSKLLGKLDNYQGQSLTFVYGDKIVDIPLNELKIAILNQETIDQLPYFNFSKDSFVHLIGAAFTDQNLNPVFKKDDLLIFNTVEKKLGLDQQRAKSARFVFDDKKKLQISPEAEGIIIDQASLLADLNSRLESLDSEPLQIKTLKEFPPVTAQELEKYQPDLQVKLESQIVIHYGDQSWKFKAIDHLDSIDFRKQNDGVVIAVSPKLAEEFLQNEIIAKIEKPVSNLKIYYDEKDNIQFEGKALDGLLVDKEKLINDLESAINLLDQDMDVVTEVKKAELNIDQRLQDIGIKELVSTGHTAFAGSPTNRRHNVATGMSKFQGLIIKPGETFSFNDNLGEVDGSTGYKLELVIKAEGTIPEFGGGICQVSSTFFKAALFAGFPIVERSPHSYAVGYYAQVDGYGLDSTIYPGVKDLKFINDTQSNILIQTIVDGDQAYVNFFGTSDGRQVRLENYWRGNFRSAGGTEQIPTKTLPTGAKKQIESAHGGFDASWERVIVKNGEEVRDKIYSVYRATSNRILVGE